MKISGWTRKIKRGTALRRLLVIVMLGVTASMCDDNVPKLDGNAVQNSLQEGNWRITYRFDKADETSDFTGYLFTFKDNGTVEAVKNATAVSGTWSIETSSSGTLKLLLDFGMTSPLDELNEDWKILEHTAMRIKLEDVSGGSGLTSSLIFEKN